MNRVYTEEEAKAKTCPSLGGKCVVSGCMAWRWMPGLYDDKTLKMKPQKEGYCGLAGKP